MASTNFEDLILRDTRANQPAAGVPGRIYYVTDENVTERDNGATWQDISDSGGGAGSDTTAIHDNVASEISAITEKTSLTGNDLFVIEDSADSNNKKRVKFSNLGAGGAPTTSEYVTTAADGGLSAEVVIPGFAGSADKAGAAGAGVSYEFDSSDLSAWTASSAPDTVDADTTIKSHLYFKTTDTTERFYYVSWSPAGAFDARMKISHGSDAVAVNYAGGIYIASSDNSSRLMMESGKVTGTGAHYVAAYTYSGSYTQRGSTHSNLSTVNYIRVTRDGSNNVSFYYSNDGLLWSFIATQAHTLTVARLGFRFSSDASVSCYYACDWLRADV